MLPNPNYSRPACCGIVSGALRWIGGLDYVYYRSSTINEGVDLGYIDIVGGGDCPGRTTAIFKRSIDEVEFAD
jgi:hypothetical protein